MKTKRFVEIWCNFRRMIRPSLSSHPPSFFVRFGEKNTCQLSLFIYIYVYIYIYISLPVSPI